MRNPMIWSLSTLWSAASAASRTAALIGAKKPVVLPARVVSVGNIQVGGAGKTPLVAEIAREGQRRGLNVCILSRGYRGKWERSGGIIAPGDRVSTSDCGDECVLLHLLAPESFIGVGADRVGQFEKIRRSGAKIDLVILDDGFQNTQIRKDIDLVALTSSDAWHVLHRDWPGALEHAHLLVWTKGAEQPDVGESAAPLVRIRFTLAPARTAEPMWLVAGVGNGAEVVNSARAAGYNIIKPLIFRDHVRYNAGQARKLLERARATGARLALTGKDWVKWRDLGVAEADVTVLEPAVEFISGQESWVKVLWGSD